MTEQTTKIFAVSTYGTQTKIYQGKRLSALKIGYSGIISKILLKLLPDAVDISSKRDSYVYIYIPNKPKLRHGWLFIEVNAEKLAQVEAMTMSCELIYGIAVWQNSKWMLPPSQLQAQYHEPHGSGDTPKGSPAGFWAIRADGTKGPTGGSHDRDQIIADYSKLDPHKSAWWWIPGNDATYKNLSELKRYGCRWKRKRRAFAYVGDKLSEGLLNLLDNAEECRAIMNGMNPDEAKRRYRYIESTDEAVEGQIAKHSVQPELAEIEHEATDIDLDPCSLDEAKSALGIATVSSHEPLSVYPRGRSAWTSQNLPQGVEGRTEHVPVGTKYKIVDIDFSGDLLNPIYVIEYGDHKTARVQEEELIPMRQFKVDDKVYAAQDTKTTEDKKIPTGTEGRITKLYRFNPTFGSLRGHTYDVDWVDIGTEWMFGDELSTQAPQVGIRVTRGTFVPSSQGTTSADDRKTILQAGHKSEAINLAVKRCICEDSDGPKGWLPAKNLGTWITCGSCNPDGKHMPQLDPADLDAEKPPAIRILKPLSLNTNDPDDAIANAIRQTANLSQSSAIVQTELIQSKASPLPMECVGELTGSVIANVHCYGYALDGDELIFLNMGGPRSGVEAIRAKLSKGDIVNLNRWDAPSIELTAGEGNTGVYTAYINNMQEARFVHCMLAHERLVHPNYNGSAKTYIIQMSEEQAKAQLLRHVRETVKLPVFHHWIDYLWQAGQVAKLVRNTRAGGGLTIKAIDLDVDSWGRLIQYGVAEKAIAIPQPQQD